MFKKLGNIKFIIRIVLVLLLFAVVVGAVTIQIVNRDNLNIHNIQGLIDSVRYRSEAKQFVYGDDQNCTFADMNGGLALASPLGIQVFDKNGTELYVDSFDMKTPIVVSAGKLGVAYDFGGTEFCVFNQTETKSRTEVEGSILSASLNKRGWLALCTQESGYNGLVTVYDNNNQPVYKWHSGEGYVTSAVVSPDNQSLAVITLVKSGSRIVFLKLNSEDLLGEYYIDGDIALELRYINADTVQVVTDKRTVSVASNGEPVGEFDYEDKYIDMFTLSGDKFAAVVYSDYQIGSASKLMLISENGEQIAQLETEAGILDISSAGQYTAVLYAGKLVIYDDSLQVYAEFTDISGNGGVIMRRDGTAVIIGNNAAKIYR